MKKVNFTYKNQSITILLNPWRGNLIGDIFFYPFGGESVYTEGIDFLMQMFEANEDKIRFEPDSTTSFPCLFLTKGWEMPLEAKALMLLKGMNIPEVKGNNEKIGIYMENLPKAVNDEWTHIFPNQPWRTINGV